MTWTVTRVPPSADLDAPEAWATHGAAAVSRAGELATWGDADLAYTPRYLATQLREHAYAPRACWVATAPDAPSTPQAVLGWALAILPQQGNEHLAELEVVVHPAHRRRGIGTALLDTAETFARQDGRSTAIVASDHAGEPPVEDPSALEAPTGSGRIRSDAAPSVFATRRGYRLEQAERYSVLDLPVAPDTVARLHADAAVHAGPDYRLLTWTDHAPEDRLDQVAVLCTRMSTDTPLGGLDIEEDRWDPGRVRDAEQRVTDAGHGSLVVAVEHLPTATLVGFTEVEYPHDDPGVVFQQDTIVLAEHRGRRLGMLVKTDLLARLTALRPEARRVHTWNAEENAHMLAINSALGFRPRGVAGLWQRTLG